MASLREVFDREVALTYVSQQPERLTPFWDSGAFVTDNRISRLVGSGSPNFTVPYLNPIDSDLEPNYGNTILTDIAMPRGIDGGAMNGRMASMNEGFLESRLEKHLTGVSPLAEIGRYVNTIKANWVENRTVATLIGLRNYDQANGGLFTTEVAATFDFNAFAEAEAQMMDQYEGQGAIVVHPNVYLLMRKQNMLDITPPSDVPQIATYNGRRVIKSKKGTQVGTQYVSYLLNNGAFIAESSPSHDDMELERTASTGNGAGHTTLWVRQDTLIHPQGFSFVADPTTLTGGTKNEALFASWSDLTTAANWDLVNDAEKLPFHILVTNMA